MTWNRYLNSNFSSCRLIATDFNPFTQSELRYYALPGEFANIGATDGYHSHIVPLNAQSPSIQRLKGLIDEIQQGGNPNIRHYQAAPTRQKRHEVNLDVEEFKPRVIRRARLDLADLA